MDPSFARRLPRSPQKQQQKQQKQDSRRDVEESAEDAGHDKHDSASLTNDVAMENQASHLSTLRPASSSDANPLKAPKTQDPHKLALPMSKATSSSSSSSSPSSHQDSASRTPLPISPHQKVINVSPRHRGLYDPSADRFLPRSRGRRLTPSTVPALSHNTENPAGNQFYNALLSNELLDANITSMPVELLNMAAQQQQQSQAAQGRRSGNGVPHDPTSPPRTPLRRGTTSLSPGTATTGSGTQEGVAQSVIESPPRRSMLLYSPERAPPPSTRDFLATPSTPTATASFASSSTSLMTPPRQSRRSPLALPFTSTHTTTTTTTTAATTATTTTATTTAATTTTTTTSTTHSARAVLQSPVRSRLMQRYAEHQMIQNSLSTTPLSSASHKLLTTPRKPMPKIPKTPFKVLDAPDLADDFYLNLVDWSVSNTVAVGLDANVYLWSALTSQVSQLCSVSPNATASLRWSRSGAHLAVGESDGSMAIWDATENSRVSRSTHHNGRVGSLAWTAGLLACGSRDHAISLVDERTHRVTETLKGHRQEVCGLSFSLDGQYLASGGNDNTLMVWDMRMLKAVHVFTQHCAAVKAIAWSPHQRGLLASGGGTADQTIRFWNTLTGRDVQVAQADSQVCNLAWSKTSNQLVSTHGYSHNEIIIWKYPTMQELAVLTGHTNRVLYLAMSPDGEAIVTGAGDETLRFWHVFSKDKPGQRKRSQLSGMAHIR